jgi:hypothetical protein
MTVSQTLMILHVIIENPGISSLQLAKKIEETFGKDNERVQFMFLEETDERSCLMSLVDSIYCVRNDDDRLYYDDTLLPKREDDLMDLFIASFLEEREKKKKEKRDQVTNYGENIKK